MRARGTAPARRSADRYGRNEKLFALTEDATANCPRKQARSENDPCGAICPDLPSIGEQNLSLAGGVQPLQVRGGTVSSADGILAAKGRQTSEARSHRDWRLIFNLDWWLWDDPASPGLISIERFGELWESALTADEHKRLGAVFIRGEKQTSSEDKEFSKYALQKVGNYLSEVRANDFKQLDNWLGFNFMLHDDGWVKDQNGRKQSRGILRVIAAYINCLERYRSFTILGGGDEVSF
jgi:hypothetical protein